MRTPRTCLLASALTAVALIGAGCGSSTINCEPACPTGFSCTETGCVPDSPGGGDVDIGGGDKPDMAGGCAQTCNGATPYCKSGVCVPCLIDDNCPAGSVCKQVGNSSACVPGCTDDSRCKGAGVKCCNGACVDTTKDLNNCGACGTACSGNHAAASCVAGACMTGACSKGWGDCNSNPADGCETNVQTDPKNCTACGKVCSIKNAIAGCSDVSDPSCYIAACVFGFDDCNADPMDGCETSVLSDVKNCGGCGMPCANKPNAQVACINATCALTGCAQGYFDCDKDPKNGCEVNIATDAKNCGGCGLACAQGLICKGMQCTCAMCNIPNASALCVNNQCVFDKCNPGYTDCDNNPQNGCEVNTDGDAKNCGSCGNLCPMNLPACVSGMCTNSTHNVAQLNWDFNAPGNNGCGDFSLWWTQDLGAMNYDQCEALANKYGAQYMGMTGFFGGYNAPYQNTVRWVGEADNNNGYVGSANWSVVNSQAKNNNSECVLGYANDKLPGKGTFQQQMVSNNGKTYFVNDYGVISEKTCYSNALAAGARPLNPYMFAQAKPQKAHMVENHQCHGSTEYTGAPGYGSDGNANHNYQCFVGYNP